MVTWNSRKFVLMDAALWSEIFHKDFGEKKKNLRIILETFFQMRLWKKGKEIPGYPAVS